MIEYFQQYSGRIVVPLLIFFLPGILLVVDGVRTIRNKKAVSIGRDSRFRWKKPIFLTGERAVKIGKINIVLGIVSLLIGLCMLIGIFS